MTTSALPNNTPAPGIRNRSRFVPSIATRSATAPPTDLCAAAVWAEREMAAHRWAVDGLSDLDGDVALFRWDHDAGRWVTPSHERFVIDALRWLKIAHPKKADDRNARACADTLISTVRGQAEPMPSLRWRDDVIAALSTRSHDLLLGRDGQWHAVPHAAEHGLATQIPVALDPARISPDGVYTPGGREGWQGTLWERWWMMCTDQGLVADILQEAIGSTLLNRHLEKCIVLSGEGANGKSCLLHLLTALHGEEHQVSISLSDLGQTFGLEPLMRASLVTIPDSESFLNDVAFQKLKSLLSGDRMSVNRKHKKMLSFTPHFSVVIAANNPIASKDQSYGATRRFLTIPFSNTVPVRDRIPDLHRQIIRHDMPLVLDWALEGAARLALRGFVWPQLPDAMLRVVTDQRCRTDAVFAWVQEHGVGAAGDRLTSKSEVFAHFQRWATGEGRQPLSAEAFWHRLKNTINGGQAFAEERFTNTGLHAPVKRERFIGVQVDGLEQRAPSPAPAPMTTADVAECTPVF